MRSRLWHPLARSRRGSQHRGFIARRTGTGGFGTSPNKPLQAPAKSAARLSVASDFQEDCEQAYGISRRATRHPAMGDDCRKGRRFSSQAPWQIRREGRAQIDIRRTEVVALAQAERDAEDIRS